MPRTSNINTVADCCGSLQGPHTTTPAWTGQLAGNDGVDGRAQARAPFPDSPRPYQLQACTGQACGTGAAALPASKPSASARETTHALYTTVHKPKITGWMRRIISGSCDVSCTSRYDGTTTHHTSVPLQLAGPPPTPRPLCGA